MTPQKIQACCDPFLESQPLEPQPQPDSQPHIDGPAWSRWLRAIVQKGVHWLTTQPEPRVRESIDPSGKRVWQVYDPVSHCRTQLTSEAEVRSWIEDGLYRNTLSSPSTAMDRHLHQSRLIR